MPCLGRYVRTAVLIAGTCLSPATAEAGFLTGPSDRDPADIALDHVRAHRAQLGLDADDLARLRLRDRYTSLDGVTHLVWEQVTRGIASHDTFLGANVAADGRLINVTGEPVGDLELADTRPRLSAAEATAAARAHVGGPARAPGGVGPAKLVAHAENGTTRLAWRVQAAGPVPERYEVVVDAASGRILARRSLTAHANGALIYPLHPDRNASPERVDLGADPTWIDRSEGGTKLQGNNAHATSLLEFQGDETEVAQVNGDWSFPVRFFAPPECPAFGCTFDSDDFSTRLTNREQTTTQAFWFANHFHDHLLAPPIGFDEASRNLEHVNTSGQGLGGDALEVVTNHIIANASVQFAPDGSPPTILLGRTAADAGQPWDVRFSDEAETVYHEYGHVLAGRLVGAGTNSVSGVWGQALVEAWADWFEMDLIVGEGRVPDTAAAGEVRCGAYAWPSVRAQAIDCAVGASAPGCAASGTAGAGGFTYGDFGKVHPFDPVEEHANGEVWSQTLWDLRRALGSHAARCLVAGGMRLGPASPGFLESRDAILQHALVVGVPQAAVWEVFAARGMGVNANESTIPPTEDISVPASLPPPPPASGTCGTPTAGPQLSRRAAGLQPSRWATAQPRLESGPAREAAGRAAAHACACRAARRSRPRCRPMFARSSARSTAFALGRCCGGAASPPRVSTRSPPAASRSP